MATIDIQRKYVYDINVSSYILGGGIEESIYMQFEESTSLVVLTEDNSDDNHLISLHMYAIDKKFFKLHYTASC